MSAARPAPPRRVLLAGLGAACAALLTACGSGLGQPESSSGNQQGYVSGDGTQRLVPVEERSDPVELTGEATDGSSVDVADWRGEVVVLNVWYAACAPCRVEAPDLAGIAAEDPQVRFLGINTRDGAAAAQAFEREFAVPYPSVLDAQSGAAVLALRGTIPPQAVPTTVVLDAEGRPAARIVGKADASVLRGLIEDVRSGGSGSGGPA